MTVKLGDKLLFQRSKRQRGSLNTSMKIEAYLTIKFVLDDSGLTKHFKVLNWWKQKLVNYPILSLIAKQILAIPASTVTCRSILDETLLRLSLESLEIQACVDDWTRVKYRQQKMEKNEEEEFNDAANISTLARNEVSTYFNIPFQLQ